MKNPVSFFTVSCFCAISLALAAAQAVASDGSNDKSAVLDSYLQRCVEVLSDKGYSNPQIKAECKCELDIIDQHYDIFQQMLSAEKRGNRQQINEFKKQLLNCKIKP
ncbi:hypothetical protein [Arsukibacterium sp.]|uniref:hypothetical protein n=1 Tax=Arsukibacterium sp. TaxID=1977258 RepID=UPI00299E7445|nr:hypothetical protein [Arsukibacterium sp.]MDX1678740.1 hypothetical protein [Arsukibacterium sp.]